MEDYEIQLSNDSSNSGNPLVYQILKELGDSIVYAGGDNFTVNRKLWNSYCNEWNIDEPWYLSLTEATT